MSQQPGPLVLYQRQASALYFSVIAGLDPAIQLVELNQLFKMDARVEPAHDESITVAPGMSATQSADGASKAAGYGFA
jgi:hypothetical protein